MTTERPEAGGKGGAWFALCLALVLAAACILRFYRLDEIPAGFFIDEASIGYNAFSISETGADEHGKRFPFFSRPSATTRIPCTSTSSSRW